MRTEQARIEPDAAYPVADETRILPDRKAPVWLTLRGKKEIIVEIIQTQSTPAPKSIRGLNALYDHTN